MPKEPKIVGVFVNGGHPEEHQPSPKQREAVEAREAREGMWWYIGSPSGRPQCPACGDERGQMGTSCAYFICFGGCDPHYVYWLGDHRHPDLQGKTWDDAIMASPYARRDDVERIARAAGRVEAEASLQELIEHVEESADALTRDRSILTTVVRFLNSRANEARSRIDKHADDDLLAGDEI